MRAAGYGRLTRSTCGRIFVRILTGVPSYACGRSTNSCLAVELVERMASQVCNYAAQVEPRAAIVQVGHRS
jgi:hypothetical protein